MLYTFQYQDESERQILLTQNSNKYLIEEQNVLSGNYLIFTDDKPLTEQIRELQIQSAQSSNDLMEFMDFYFANQPV